MSPHVTKLCKEQAILQAVRTLIVTNSVPSIEEIATQAGFTRQYLHRLAKKRLAAMGAERKEKAGVRTDDPATSLPVAGGGEEPEHTQPQGVK